MDLLTANYTFVNERLAKHYRIPERLRQSLPAGDVRRRSTRRAARPGQHPDGDVVSRTARRRWCAASGCSRTCSARRRRRRRPTCRRSRRAGQMASPARCASGWRRTARIRRAPSATCGWIRWGSRWRTSTRWASGAPSATARRSTRPPRFPTGRSFEGVAGLRNLLVSHREDFVRTFTEKLLAYALGRGVEYYDLPAVRKITREARRTNYRWSSLIAGIVKARRSRWASSRSRRPKTASPRA